MLISYDNRIFSSLLQGESGSGLHGVNGGAGTPASAELQADGDPEESLAGAGQSRLASTEPCGIKIRQPPIIKRDGHRTKTLIKTECNHLQ